MNGNQDSSADRSIEEALEEMEAQYAADDCADVETSSGNDQDVQSPEELVQLLEHQVAEHKKRELQAQAELENFRKRLLRDAETQLKYASLPLIKDLLEAVDNLNRATDAAKQAASSNSSDGLLAGVTMVCQQLSNILAKHQCIVIESLGKEFDPNFHEAISQAPSQEYAAGVVMFEATKGYRMYDRVIRPSQVIVSTGAPNT